MSPFECKGKTLITDHNVAAGTCDLLFVCSNFDTGDNRCPFQGHGDLGKLPLEYPDVPLYGQNPKAAAGSLEGTMISRCLAAVVQRRKTI